MNTLQTFVFPNLEVRAPEALYVRLHERSWADLTHARIHFEPGGLASSDTFYNGLTVGAWKRTCDIRSLVLCLEGSGEFVVTIGLHRFDHELVWLSDHGVVLSAGQTTHLPIRAWESVTDGLLFFRIRCIGGGTLERADYVSPDEPLNDVRLGLVVTHFNRQAQVVPAIQRISRSLLQRPDLRERVTLTVVDNSRNLALPPLPGVAVIPNRNLGGTGGFVRGLLSLIDGGTHTHVLFMDDDASCEVESIARTHALLSYARTPRLAIAGSLLSEANPWLLTEKGARFDGECRPLHAGADMRRVEDLLAAERAAERPDYGGWWFFAFAIADIRQYPFPFFVRGDDVLFSLGNGFDILTMNGIACLGEEFSYKHGPLTSYLDARYHLLHAVLRPDGHAAAIRRLAAHQFLRPLLAYHYATARAFTLAMRHLLQGPRLFRDNLDTAQIRAEIAALTPSEKMQPLQNPPADLCGWAPRPERWWRTLARLLTLQGFLLPRAWLKRGTLWQPKSFHGDPVAVFRFPRVRYEHAGTGTGYVAEHDRDHFFATLKEFGRTLQAFRRRLPALRREFQEGYAQMTTIEFWREVYAAPEAPAPTAASPAAPSPAVPFAVSASSAPTSTAPTSLATANPTANPAAPIGASPAVAPPAGGAGAGEAAASPARPGAHRPPV